jgi:hypothetical protein
MFLRFSRVFPLTTLALLLGTTAQAQTLIYNNGSFATSNALPIDGQSIADDFTLGSSQSFDSVRVWLTDAAAPNNLLNAFSGTLSWRIYDNNAGMPGTSIASGTTSTVGLTDTGTNVFGFRIFQADFSIPTQSLGAGTYWFRIKENGLNAASDGTNLFWLNSASSTGFATQASAVINPTAWATASSINRAFQFYSTVSASAPEPGTLAFLTLGGTLVLVKRRRRQS